MTGAGAAGERRRQAIGLLGGSFNPAHAGHREISLAALDALELDAVWWLVSPGNPLKDPGAYAPYETRMAEARRLASHPQIVVSNFEARRGLQYTVDTLRMLTDLWPQIAFVWLMGADSLANLHLWKEWRAIVDLAPIAVFSRPGSEAAALDSEAGRLLAPFRMDLADAPRLAEAATPAWVYVPTTANPLSSTAIRNARGQP